MIIFPQAHNNQVLPDPLPATTICSATQKHSGRQVRTQKLTNAKIWYPANCRCGSGSRVFLGCLCFTASPQQQANTRDKTLSIRMQVSKPPTPPQRKFIIIPIRSEIREFSWLAYKNQKFLHCFPGREKFTYHMPSFHAMRCSYTWNNPH